MSLFEQIQEKTTRLILFVSFLLLTLISPAFSMKMEELSESPKTPIITKEMETYFYTRTQQHIERVTKNMLLMKRYKNLEDDILHMRGNAHDKSKLSDPE